MELIEVFKTDVEEPAQAQVVVESLLKHLPGCEINFDLDDCDRILRIAGYSVETDKVKMLLNEWGFECECLL